MAADLALDSGPLEALTPDDAGVLREWSPKYAVISEPLTDNATLSIFSSAQDVIDSEAEVDINVNDCEVQISKEPSFERCFTITANGLKVFLRAQSVQEREAWVLAIRQASKPLPPPSMPPPPEEEEEEQEQAQNLSSSNEYLRVTGYAYVWEDATQSWSDLVFLYLSAGYLHEFRAPFRFPSRTHDLTQNCAIRMRGTPPCVEMKLTESSDGVAAIFRFYGRVEHETVEWVRSIKTRALEPPQRFVDCSVAAFDAFSVERSVAKSFFVRTGTLNSLLAGAQSTFPIVGTSEDANQYAEHFTASLRPQDDDDDDDAASLLPDKAKGTFHILADDTLNLRLAYNKQGKYAMHVKFRGEHIFQSPFEVQVHSALPSAPHSVVCGRGILYAPMPGQQQVSKFTVTLRDRFLNLCESTTVDASKLDVACFGPAALLQTKYVGEGSFEISYKTTHMEEEVSIEVSYAGVPVAGSPFFPVFAADQYAAGQEEEEERKTASGKRKRGGQEQQQQQLSRAAAAAAAAPPPPPVDQTTEDLALSRRVTLQSEAMSSFLSAKIRKEWANHHSRSSHDPHQQQQHYMLEDAAAAASSSLDTTFPQHEQLEMLMQSSALRTTPASGAVEPEPAYLRSFAVEIDNGARTPSRWEPEPILPPWAPIAAVTAQARRARRDLQECLDPLVKACKDELETSSLLEPKPRWKRLLLDWRGAERASLADIKQLSIEVSASALGHRQLVCGMCDAILRVEQDLDMRRKAKRQETGALLALDEDAGEGEEEEEEKKQAINPREELRKRIQSLALGGKPQLQLSTGGIVGSTSAAHLQRGSRRELAYQDEAVDETDIPATTTTSTTTRAGEAFEVGDLVVVDEAKVGVVRHAGPTEFAPGDWLGLELNAPEGKNNGTVDGHEYFRCKPKCGLFVRPDRVAAFRAGGQGSAGAAQLLLGNDRREEEEDDEVDSFEDASLHEDGGEPVEEEDGRDADDDFDSDGDGDIWQHAADESSSSYHPQQQQQPSSYWDDEDSEDAPHGHNNRHEEEEDEEFFAPSPPRGGNGGASQQSVLLLTLGSLANVVDARDLAAALKTRANTLPGGRLTREAFVTSMKRWEPLADTHQLVGFFDSLLQHKTNNNDTVDPVELNPFLVCLCDTAVSNPSAAFYLLDLNRSGLLERGEVDRFARALFTVQGGGRGNSNNNNNNTVALAKRVVDRALKRYSALGTSLSYDEFDMWLDRNAGLLAGVVEEEAEAHATDQSALYDNEDGGWAQVQRWLEERVGVTLAFEKKAAEDALRESNLCTLDAIAQLTPREVNHLSLSFDLRLRLVTQVRNLAKARKQASSMPGTPSTPGTSHRAADSARRQQQNQAASPRDFGAPSFVVPASPLRHPLD